MSNNKIRVLIVDDSAFIRKMFTEFLSSDPAIEVLGTAVDPHDARQKIKQLNPDVITLDIEMPKMDGIAFLEKIMTLRPMPVVMVSTLTQKGADKTLQALELGAFDFVSKPTEQLTKNIEVLKDDLIAKVKAAASAKVRPYDGTPLTLMKHSKPFSPIRQGMLIAIGSSTGGVEALRHIIPMLPKECPPIAITQHMPEHFTASFAARLDGMSQLTVSEATNGQLMKASHAYVAPGGYQLRIQRMGAQYKCIVTDGEKVSGHKPSVDALFDSVADVAGDKAIGVILTGMGKDGAIGMKKMRQAGARTLGQNESSCVVYGMPKAAMLAGAVEKELALDVIAKGIVECFT